MNIFCQKFISQGHFLLDKIISYVNNPHVKKFRRPQPSDSLFPYTDSHETYVQLRRTHDAIHRHVSKKLKKWGLSVPKYGVLVRVYDHKQLPISYLSTQIFRGNSNMTTLINRLEKDGLVCRSNGDKDRRVKMIRLTPKGIRLAPKVIKEYRSFQQQMMDCLSHREKIELLALLKRLKDSL